MEDIKAFEPFFGHWKLGGQLGEGSVSKVYRIYSDNDIDDQEAALRVTHIFFPDSVKASAKTRRQYIQEHAREVKSQFDMVRTAFAGHPNIVQYQECQVVDLRDDAYVFERMELLETLTDRIGREGLTQRDIVDVGIDIANALIACHEKGIVHRDVKPANILCSPTGYKLGDFNIATDMETASEKDVVGSFHTIAPEVLNLQPYDFRADIYSLGMTLYLLLNKLQQPFSNLAEKSARLRARGRQIPPIKGVDDKLMSVVLKACRFQPENRYFTSDAFCKALKNITISHDKRILEPSDMAEERRDQRTIMGRVLFNDTVPPDNVTVQPVLQDDAPSSPDDVHIILPETDGDDWDTDWEFPEPGVFEPDTDREFPKADASEPDLFEQNKNVVSWAFFTFILSVIPIVFYSLCHLFLSNSNVKQSVLLHEIVFFTIVMLSNMIKTILFGNGRKKHKNTFFLLGTAAALLLLVAYGLFVVIIVTEVIAGLTMQDNLLYCSIPVCIASIVMGYYAEHMEDRI